MYRERINAYLLQDLANGLVQQVPGASESYSDALVQLYSICATRSGTKCQYDNIADVAFDLPTEPNRGY